ncbi:MAG: protease inhibitor I42 family protein, partial [Bacteroidetes bacterium]|nr:protease inhibitor I42 family protein [Bacteroidota bacterium]
VMGNFKTKTDMKNLISFLSLLLISSFCLCQNVIRTDTTIFQTISVNESFELRFENWPGTGYGWFLPENHDSTQVTIHLRKEELMEGYGAKGGKYISTYEYTGLTRGTFLLEYSYGRPWLKEKLRKCNLKIIVK